VLADIRELLLDNKFVEYYRNLDIRDLIFEFDSLFKEAKPVTINKDEDLLQSEFKNSMFSKMA